MSPFVRAVALFLLVAACGCRAQQLARDQDHIRNAVMDLHTNQIMDNLIRARKGLPILQLDYIHMTGTVTDTGSTTAGYTHTDLNAVARTLTNLFNINGTATKVNQLTITAEPVTTAPEVYNAYLAFLKEPEHLIESTSPPPDGAALIVRCCAPGCDSVACTPKWYQSKVYYWIPCASKDDFFRLALFTVAMRGQPITISHDFEASITGFDPTPIFSGLNPLKPDEAGTYYVGFSIDKRIPNDSGYLNAVIKGFRFETSDALTIIPRPNSERAFPNQPLTEHNQTSTFVLVYNPKQLNPKQLELTKSVTPEITDVIAALTNQKVKIHLNNFAPSGSQTDRLLEDVRSQLELNRLNQFQFIPTGR
jgi:hypothetical protein